jgi:[citrate (pro-3S)-lyase] ligase
VAAERGYTNVKVFTKPENRALFESLGFQLLASAPKAILMENGRGLEDYCAYLRRHQAAGVIIMNANPFTLGHRYLVEQAESRNLVVIPVKEDVSRFLYSERIDMIRRGCGDLADVVEGSDYQISAATFPTYFLKDLSDAAETQMRLDIDLFGRHIAPALGATVRFVGSEPSDLLTARYNALMKELLPAYGVRVVEVQRLKGSNGCFIKATRVRELLDQGRFRAAAALTPASTWPYLLADLAERALRMELDTPLKPGLVGPDSVGAHADMDYSLMRKGIDAIRPFFPRMAMAGSPEELRQLGIDAERAMLAATGGVNTHRGAIFALGLALNAAGRRMEGVENERVMQNRVRQLAQSIIDKSLTDSELHSTASSHGGRAVKAHGVKGAMQMALEGYRELFDSWLPYYRSVKADAFGLQRTLLKIMSELDDTCVIHRVGYERAQQVKAEAGEIAGQAGNDGKCQAGNDGKCQAGNDGKCRAGDGEGVMPDLIGHLKGMCERYAAEGISPGGAADMLALTIFMDSILN